MGKGPVVYWMSRDQRVHDNYALIWAQQEAIIQRRGLVVVFCHVPNYQGAAPDHFTFMLNGLSVVSSELQNFNIPFVKIGGTPEDVLPGFLKDIDAGILVCEFDPLRVKRNWQKNTVQQLDIPVFEIDAHNIVPTWLVSEKKEYAAYTFRPKINLLLPEYLVEIPELTFHPYSWSEGLPPQEQPQLQTSPLAIQPCRYTWIEAGEKQAIIAAERFIDSGLQHYSEQRNNPCMNGQSGLSPYLHFGQLSAQRLALMVSGSALPNDVKGDFLEELIVRRELSDNFCYYEPAYDSFEGFPEWARTTLDQHRSDPREYIYFLQQFENGETHEPLWNSCQKDLVVTGKLHGYLRMYWAKKILEWTPDPETALTVAITLNDRYSLDGRDPNGYTGIAWSIGGVHDRAWKERPIFGKIRFMNESGCRRKFNVGEYLAQVDRQTIST